MNRMRKFMTLPLEDLKFPENILTLLKKNGVCQIGPLIQHTAGDLAKFKLSKTDINYISKELKKLHLQLGLRVDARLLSNQMGLGWAA